MLALLHNLQSFLKSMRLPQKATAWYDYYDETRLSDEYVSTKLNIVSEWLGNMDVKSVIDLGANTGKFSRLAAGQAKDVVAIDADPACIELLYRQCITENIPSILPLCVDLVNPSPAIGWNNRERESFIARYSADVVLALALVHHLAIASNISFRQIADLLKSMCRWLIIEFVSKDDPKTQLLLRSRKDIFDQYDEAGFTKIFTQQFEIVQRREIPGTNRILFLMNRK